MSEQPAFWFAAKRYGYGWGVPVRWEGWAVLVGYIALACGGIYYFKSEPAALLAYVALLTIALVAVLVVKGERPLCWRWRGK